MASIVSRVKPALSNFGRGGTMTYGMADSVSAAIVCNAYYICPRPQDHVFMANFLLAAIILHQSLIKRIKTPIVMTEIKP